MPVLGMHCGSGCESWEAGHPSGQVPRAKAAVK